MNTKMMILTVILLMSGCYYTDMDGDPTECQSAAECSDGDPCTFDFCEAGECAHQNTCEPPPDCESAADCGDDDSCTFDYCEAGECAHMEICEPHECETDSECERDGLECTVDLCDDGFCRQIDNCPACDSEVHVLTLPTQAVNFGVAAKEELAIITWRESDEETGQSYVATLVQEPDEIVAVPLATTAGHGAKHVNFAWPGANPLVLWSEWDGTQNSIHMSEFNPTDSTLGSSRRIYHEYNSSLGAVAVQDSDELGIAWTEWPGEVASPQTVLGRFSFSGDLVEKIVVSDADSSYGPHIIPVIEGYRLVYTDYDIESGNNAMMRTYTYSDGLSLPTQLNQAPSRSAAISALADQDLIAWFQLITDEISALNVSWFGEGEILYSLPLDYFASGIAVLGSREADETLLSWCSPTLPEAPSAVKTVKITSASVTLILYQEISEADCRDTGIVKIGGKPTIFWLDSEGKLSFRTLCF